MYLKPAVAVDFVLHDIYLNTLNPSPPGSLIKSLRNLVLMISSISASPASQVGCCSPGGGPSYILS